MEDDVALAAVSSPALLMVLLLGCSIVVRLTTAIIGLLKQIGVAGQTVRMHFIGVLLGQAASMLLQTLFVVEA